MKFITDTLEKEASIVQAEIDADENLHDYFWPVSKEHQIFEQAYMKFVNRNLNYFYFESMIAQVKEGNEFNPAFPKTLDFCRSVRKLVPKYSQSPFGRMCIWNLPPGKKLLPHRDNYKYHRFIMRNIFVISDNHDDLMKINIEEQPVKVKKGVLFQFSPASELHEFENQSDKPFYFLGFDFWHLDLLEVLFTLVNVNKIIDDEERLAGYGGNGTKFKYISKH